MVEVAARRLTPPSGDEARGFQTPTFPLRPEGAGFQTPTFPMFPLRPEGSKCRRAGGVFPWRYLTSMGSPWGLTEFCSP